MKRYTRREVLKIIGVSAAAGAAWKLGLASDWKLVEVSESRVLMGTVVNLTVIGDDRDAANTAVTAALDHMTQLESILSRHQPNSELSRLNRDGRLDRASQPLLDVIAQAAQISDISHGAFDVSMKPLLDLYQAYQKQDALPPDTAVAAILPLVNYRNLQISQSQISFAQPGMSITLDGIGKGYIVDAGTAVLRQHGFTNVMVEAGGDLMASGERETAQPWRVGVQSPRPQAGHILAKFNLNNQAAATSGDYLQSFTADYSQHHILDPRTGFSAPELASVTVTAPSAMLADGLATAVAVAGQQTGLQLINQIRGCEALLVTKEMNTIATDGFLI
jgi:thiamine biosynthesis lipoprotein